MLEELKQVVLEVNQALSRAGLALFTWGNASGIDHGRGLVVIKPSGVSYEELRPEDMVVVDLDGRVVEGRLRPSSDTPTHVALYRAFPEIGGVVHTHSRWATAWAQAGRAIPALGTTHADYFFGEVPCTREMSVDEISRAYELETGNVIIETVRAQATRGRGPLDVPGVLVRGHAAFCWGRDASDALHNAQVLELVAEMAYHTMGLNRTTEPISEALLRKHFLRKHGPGAYYGQA
ncbi:MAG: L-ribulose-5-phosphate 4-epimerase [Alicyclobacillus sp.]|nr:L-ribulose-5-phosphate 4-epimerase [Alicyclobacillus sp.]